LIATPQQLQAEVAARGIDWLKSETCARAEINAGLPLLAALAKYWHR